MKDIVKRNNVRILGRGKQPMMFAHGFIGDQNIWRFVSPAFEEKYRVILFDYVGTGESDSSTYHEQRYANLEGYARDVIEICEALHLSDVVFVGHSVSGMIGLIAAIGNPEYFSSMIFIGPSPCYLNEKQYHGGFEKSDVYAFLENMEKDFLGWAKETAAAVINDPDKPEFEQELVAGLLKRDRKMMKNFALATFFSDYRKELLKFKIPCLILQCRNDKMVPVQVGDYLHAHLENSTLNILNAKGHFPNLTAPDEVIAGMLRFFKAQRQQMHEARRE